MRYKGLEWKALINGIRLEKTTQRKKKGGGKRGKSDEEFKVALSNIPYGQPDKAEIHRDALK